MIKIVLEAQLNLYFKKKEVICHAKRPFAVIHLIYIPGNTQCRTSLVMSKSYPAQIHIPLHVIETITQNGLKIVAKC